MITEIVVVVLFSCKKEQNKTIEKNEMIILKDTVANKLKGFYFDFNIVEHYHSDIEEKKVYLYSNPNSTVKKSEKDSKRIEILMEDLPDHLPDQNYGKELEELDFKKTIIDQSKNKEIKK